MAATLKDQNRLGLYAVMAANLALYFAVSGAGAVFSGDWAALAGQWAALLPAGLGLIVVGVLNAQAASLNHGVSDNGHDPRSHHASPY